MEGSENKIKGFLKSFAKTIKLPEKTTNKLIIVAPYGPSCVGKTTVMRYLSNELPLVHIQNDAIRLFLRREGMDKNEFLYEHHLLGRVGEFFLNKGYNIILDANFASDHEHIPQAEKLAEKYNAEFFLIKVTAPNNYILKKLRSKKFLPLDEGGLLPDAETAIGHFLRSSKQFDYEKIMPKTTAVVDSSKPLGPQLKNTIGILKEAMGNK